MTTILARDMYDAVPGLVDNIPVDAFAVAGYVDSTNFTWPQSAWDRFPDSIKTTITTTGRVRAHWADCENGDLTPQQAYDLFVSGGCLGIYCNFSTWSVVQGIFTSHRRDQPPYWIAQYPGGGRVLPVLNGVSAVAHQYANTAKYDLSCITDTFLSVIGVNAMATEIDLGESIGNDTTNQQVPLQKLFDLLWAALSDGAATPHGQNLFEGIKSIQDKLDALATTVNAEQSALLAAIQGEGVPQVTQAELQAALAALNIGPAVAAALAALLAKAAGTP